MTSEIMGQILSLVGILGKIVSIIMVILGVFKFVMSMRDADHRMQSEAIRTMLSGIMITVIFSFFSGVMVPYLTATEENFTEFVEEVEENEEDPVLAEIPDETEEDIPEYEETTAPAAEIVEDVPEVRSHFSIGSFVLGGFCISAILGALGFAVVYANKNHKEEQNEEESEEKSVKTMTYEELINKWCNKAELFHDNKVVEILKNISNDLRDLDIYHGRGLVEDNVVERVYSIYLEDLPKYYGTYCNYVDIDTPASKDVISSIKENLEAIHSTLRNAICVEIDKDAVMTDMQIDASRTSLNAMASQHGYVATGSK